MTPTSAAVVGGSGPLGRRLLAGLTGTPGPGRVVARPEAVPAPGEDLAGAAVLVHLGGADDGESGDPQALRRWLEVAARAGVHRVVHLSSTAAYGAWSTNPLPLTEDAPLRPNPGLRYASRDAERERLLDDWARRGRARRASSLRIAPVIAGEATTRLARLAAGLGPVRVRPGEAPVQVVHVDDVVGAIAGAIAGEVPAGPVNVTATGWLTRDEADAVLERRRRPALPPGAVARAVGARTGADPRAVLAHLVHPCIVANDRLRAAGWAPRHSNEESILLGLR